MRIAVIHTGWPLQGLICDFANGLVDQGHDVRLIATSADDAGLADLGSLRAGLDLVPTLPVLDKIERQLRRRFATAAGGDWPSSPPWVHGGVARALARWGRPHVYVGVEKNGLDLADACAGGLPVVYYSLELYVEDHPALPRFAWQRHRERQCHARARGTIVQDPSRWQVLRAANRVPDQAVFFLPVGLQRPSGPERAEGAGTLLSLGVQGPGRYTHELVAAAPRLPPRLQLHLHGPVYDGATRRLAESALPANVRFTTRLLPQRQLTAVLASADIGLALYRCDDANDRLTAYSSQRVAMYLQAGMPIISFRNDAYADLFARFPCGEMIDELGALGATAVKLLGDYAAYSAAARAAFEDIFRLDRYWPKLSAFLAACADRRDPAGVC